MVLERDSAAGTFALPYREVLMERGGALDRWRICTCRLVDIIDAAVRCHGTQMGARGARIVSSVGLNDIVLDQGSCGPAVQSNQTVATSIDGARVLDCPGNILALSTEVVKIQISPCCSSLPANACNNIGVGAGPSQRVGAGAEGEGIRARFDIVGVIIAAVGTGFIVSDCL